MATRERRLAQFDGSGEPPPNQPVEVLCEDHSGTYQLPFACRWVDGQWRNEKTGGTVEAAVVGWRLPRTHSIGNDLIRSGRGPQSAAIPAALVPKCDARTRRLKVRNADGTNRA